jgi:Spy/CpxP family protein refolding chaperone
MTKKNVVRMTAGLAVVVLLLAAAVAVVTRAQQASGTGDSQTGHGGTVRPRGLLAGLRRGLAQLGLSNDQKQQIKGILRGHRQDIRSFSDRRRQVRRALVDAILDDESEVVIRQKSADLAQVQADAAVFAATLHKQVFAVLTADQQAMAKTLRARALDRIDQSLANRKHRLQ